MADGGSRTIALIHGQVDSGFVKIAFVLSQKEPGLRTLIAPVQDHLNFGLVLRECWCCKYGGHRGPCEFRKMSSCDGHVFAPILVCVGRALKISSDLAVKP